MDTRTGVTRREFLRSSLITVAGLATGVSGATLSSPPTLSESLRLVFATDIHLMQNNVLRSAEGLAAAVEAIKELRPRPDLIVCGGDLTHPSPNLDYPAANKLLDRFLGIWTPLHSIETHYVFGNHDFVGTRNPRVSRHDPRFGKGLFEKRLDLPRLYYSFKKRGWRFIVLDDVGESGRQLLRAVQAGPARLCPKRIKSPQGKTNRHRQPYPSDFRLRDIDRIRQIYSDQFQASAFADFEKRQDASQYYSPVRS